MYLVPQSITRMSFLSILGFLLIFTHGAISSETYPIAGTQPDARPTNAPIAPPLEKTTAWYSHAVSGVEEPYPASLQFLETQGKWYTPFTLPGMTGRYDIRGWHAEKK